jgi:hypothetical protein
MATREDLESWLDRLGLPTESIGEDIWLVRTADGAELAVNHAPPVLVIRTRVMELPSDAGKAGELCRKLMVYNARDLVHGSYGVEDEHIVLTDALELGHLEFSEFESSIDSLVLALASHMGALAPYRE